MASSPRDRRLPLGEPDEQTWIVESAVARVLSTAVDRLAGVRVDGVRLVPEPDLRGVRVHVAVAAGPFRALHELADAVRDQVDATAREAVGLRLCAVDVAVVDLLTEDGRVGQDGQVAQDGHDVPKEREEGG